MQKQQPHRPTDLFVGSVTGLVTANGAGLPGVTVVLSGGTTSATTDTDENGQYRFQPVKAGTYTVSISGFPSDVVFPQTSQTIEHLSDISRSNVNFEGMRVTSGRLTGTVTAHGNGLGGVDVLVSRVTSTVSGVNGDGGQIARRTDSAGAYSVDPIAGGDWRVEVGDVPGVLFDPSRRDLRIIRNGQEVVADFNGRRLGTYSGRLMVKSDTTPPHDPFVFAAGSSGKDVLLEVDSLDFDPGSPIFLAEFDPLGPSSLPSLQGPIQRDDSFTLTGSGPIAMRAIVGVVGTGRFIGSMLEVEIEVGCNGELGGGPVIYTFSGNPQ